MSQGNLEKRIPAYGKMRKPETVYVFGHAGGAAKVAEPMNDKRKQCKSFILPSEERRDILV